MCLTKKYQYLYLIEKLHTLSTEETLHDVGHSGFLPIFNRIGFYYDWLHKINNKYKYTGEKNERNTNEQKN